MRILPDEMKVQIRQSPQVTVEIGTGDRPLFTLGGTTQYDAEHLYVGIDIDRIQHEKLLQKVQAVGGLAVRGTAGTLPLGDGSVGTVFMANVFGEPDSRHIMHHVKDQSGTYHGNTAFATKLETLAEVRRVLTPDTGRLVVLETITPYGDNYMAMRTLLMAQGFDSVDVSRLRTQAGRDILAPYAAPQDWWHRESYVAIAG